MNTWGVSEDIVLLARAMKKILSDGKGSVWWYGEFPGEEPEPPYSTTLGIDGSFELTEDEAAAVRRTMGGPA